MGWGGVGGRRVDNVALAFGLYSCSFQACGGMGGLGARLVTSRLSSVSVLSCVPGVFVLFSRLRGGGVRGGLVTARRQVTLMQDRPDIDIANDDAWLRRIRTFISGSL